MKWTMPVELVPLDEIDAHNHRVAYLASSVAAELGLSISEQIILFNGARHHDVGKKRVNPSILNKQALLTSWERAQVERHVLHGIELIRTVPGAVEWAYLVRSHHERLDGSGYPEGLTAEQIPTDVRILSVCDMYDALTTDRPYRRALSPLEAMSIIHGDTPHKLDPRVVAALERCLNVKYTPDSNQKTSLAAVKTAAEEGA